MSQEDLIPITTKERAKELGSRGGKVVSFKKKYAAKIREMKKKAKLTGQDLTWFEQTMIDPEASGVDMGADLILLRDKLEPKEYIQLKQANHKLRFGEKLKTENVHHIVNWTDLLSGGLSGGAKEFKRTNKGNV